MRNLLTTIVILTLLPLGALAADKKLQRLYRWVDSEGVIHYGDTIPAEYSDLERQVVNEHGITVDVMDAKKTEEEIAEDLRQEELRQARELQRRQDHALLATYLSVDEILLHRDLLCRWRDEDPQRRPCLRLPGPVSVPGELVWHPCVSQGCCRCLR